PLVCRHPGSPSGAGARGVARTFRRAGSDRQRSVMMGSLRYVRTSLLTLGALVLLLGPGSSAAADRVKVVATTVQISALTTAVAGDLVELKGLIPAGGGPPGVGTTGGGPRGGGGGG